MFDFSQDKRLLVALLVIFLILILGGFLFFQNLKSKKDIAAIVNGEKILKKDFDRRVEVMTYFYTNISPEPERLTNIKKEQLEFLIRLKLLEQFLQENNRVVTNEELDRYTEQKAEHRGGLENYDKLLQVSYGSSLEDVKLNFKEQLMTQKIIGTPGKKHLYGIWFDRAKPSDIVKDITPDFQVIEEELALEEKPIYEKAKQVLARVEAGEEFGALAQEFSEDGVSRQNKGDLGIIESAEQIFQVDKEGFISLPEATEKIPSAIIALAWQNLNQEEVKLYGYSTGFAIMKVAEVTEEEKSLIGNMPFEDWYNELRKSAKVSILILNL